MSPQTNVKEVQCLGGHIAALNRFVSQSTNKCFPFFKLLKKKFEWTNECTIAFESLKQYLITPPLRSPSKIREDIFLYLVVSQTTVSSTLIQEEDGVQKPVYYTSQAFKGAEARYPSIEKMVSAIIIASWKLHPYFQAHMIIVLTDQPMKKAMNRPDAVGRMILWAIELREFNINFHPRTAIKAQALADFVAEFISREENEIDEAFWMVKEDGSSNKEAGRVGVVLETPKKDVIQYAVRLQFLTTNNEAEYKALLTGLKLEKTIRAQKLNGYSDSQLVTRQVNGEYEAV